ncbi:MAG: hypothetical protein PHR24_01840 [Oscillospiraceae bacterium]|nr:hypothetical protein [Oscillospiraceae bacterium]
MEYGICINQTMDKHTWENAVRLNGYYYKSKTNRNRINHLYQGGIKIPSGNHIQEMKSPEYYRISHSGQQDAFAKKM